MTRLNMIRDNVYTVRYSGNVVVIRASRYKISYSLLSRKYTAKFFDNTGYDLGTFVGVYGVYDTSGTHVHTGADSYAGEENELRSLALNQETADTPG